MKQSIIKKLEQLSMRLEELNIMLANSNIITDQDKFCKLSIEHSQLAPIGAQFEKYLMIQDNISSAKQMLKESEVENDENLKTMVKEEIFESKKKLKDLILEIEKALLPKDPNDSRNVIIEIRAGTGGNEAGIFAGDLFKMYASYVEKQKWQLETISSNISEQGGFKEIIARISGKMVYAKLKFESGVHRVQRVPETESQGRLHTSACTVAIMPEVKNIEEFDINMSEIRIDTFRASGAGGQHVNKTDSAIRLTHIPTGMVVECQDGRSQHKNKMQALSVLASRMLDTKRQQQQKAQALKRKALVGSGDRSQRIRTYNYPQRRISDHRINLTLYKLQDIMQGNLADIIEPLTIERQSEQLLQLYGNDL